MKTVHPHQDGDEGSPILYRDNAQHCLTKLFTISMHEPVERARVGANGKVRTCDPGMVASLRLGECSGHE